MTTKLPPGVRLGKNGGSKTLSTSSWNEPDEASSTYDERDEGEEIQPGDTVVELRNGRPVVYTEPERSTSAHSRKVRTSSPEAS